MSVISFYESVALTATETIYVEVARPFIHALNIQAFSAAALTDLIGVQITSKGQTIAPVQTAGSDDEFFVDNHAPIRIELKKEVQGPPYELAIRIRNPNGGAVIVAGSFEVYNTPYEQVRIKIPPGTEGEDPFSKWMQTQEKENK